MFDFPWEKAATSVKVACKEGLSVMGPAVRKVLRLGHRDTVVSNGSLMEAFLSLGIPGPHHFK